MKKKIGIIGLGYVGLPLAVLCAQKKYSVIGIDNNKSIVKKIVNGESHLNDKQLNKNIRKLILDKSFFVSTKENNLNNCEIFIICVSTPVNEKKEPDLSYVLSAIKTISSKIKKGNIVVLESTVYPGICENELIPMLEKLSKLKLNKDFGFAYCPERVNPGDVFWNSENIPRVLGGSSEKTLNSVAKFYSSILGGPILNIKDIKSKLKPKFKLDKKKQLHIKSIPIGSVTKMRSIKDAESVKVMENTVRDVNIALVNDLAKMSEVLNLDVVDIIDGMTTKPFGKGPFYPGTGVGGHCISVDPEWLNSASRKAGYVSKFIEISRRTNNEMPNFSVSLLKKALKNKKIKFKSAQVALLGVSYKKDVNDPRESPFYKIKKLLDKDKINLKIYDNCYLANNNVKSLKAAIKNSHAIIIITDHTKMINDLKKINLNSHGVQIVIDGRNCLNPSLFKNTKILYKGIGR